MKISCGIIGLPNVGKSTLFKCITNVSVKIANFPFCTITPNIAVINIPDLRLYKLNDIIKSRSIVHETVEFIDFAGLIQGANQGIGLGTKILHYIQKTNILCHVIRCFKDTTISHVFNTVDPNRDIEIVNTELILFDIALCEKYISISKKKHKITHSSYFDQKISILEKCLDHLYQGVLLKHMLYSKLEIEIMQEFNFLTIKPVIYIANTDPICADSNIYHQKLSSLISNINYNHDRIIIYYPVKLKNESQCIPNQAQSVLQVITNNILSLLKLNTFFTVNSNMIRAWLVAYGTTAFDISHIIHSDFKKGFIRVQVIKFNDFIKNKGEIGSKRNGKIFNEGKKYCVKEGDILKFLFNV